MVIDKFSAIKSQKYLKFPQKSRQNLKVTGIEVKSKSIEISDQINHQAFIKNTVNVGILRMDSPQLDGKNISQQNNENGPTAKNSRTLSRMKKPVQNPS